VVPATFGPVTAGEVARGHRFMAPQAFVVSGCAEWQTMLRAAKVMVDAAERRQTILARASELAGAANLTVRNDPGLLDEVTGLVEWPVVLMGRIDEAFMSLPPEVLPGAMRA